MVGFRNLRETCLGGGVWQAHWRFLPLDSAFILSKVPLRTLVLPPPPQEGLVTSIQPQRGHLLS